ncbi:hypothetical protein BD779DRAFT_1518204 [Infundibulicybe gibba]|nr:hypothetical protein BD779DRAFT_1518204 [Infundibulicybe gibba]
MAGGPNRQPSPSLTNEESEVVSTRPHTPTRPDATPARRPSPAPITLILHHIPALICARLFVCASALACVSTPTHIPAFAHYPFLVLVSGAIPHRCSPSCRLAPCTLQHVAILSFSLDNASSCYKVQENASITLNKLTPNDYPTLVWPAAGSASLACKY